MPVLLGEVKRIAVRELRPGDPLREILLGLPDRMDEAQFDLVAPVLAGLARSRARQE
ncbi:MAG TPA: hypothetical protein VGS23_06040 [Thermoplasmata archaeon]|nr:hypothetical protein [Thermoplasmata archaeon]HEV2316692.1 hypothetical protein [Thermoplasmata archaeon]